MLVVAPVSVPPCHRGSVSIKLTVGFQPPFEDTPLSKKLLDASPSTRMLALARNRLCRLFKMVATSGFEGKLWRAPNGVFLRRRRRRTCVPVAAAQPDTCKAPATNNIERPRALTNDYGLLFFLKISVPCFFFKTGPDENCIAPFINGFLVGW